MASFRRTKTSFITKLVLVTLALSIGAVLANEGQAQAAPLAAAKRCPTTATQTSVGYSCYAAYPEAFYVTGFTRSTYRLTWKVTCGGRSIGKSRLVHGVVSVIVNGLTQPSAYGLMSEANVCKIDVKATRVSGKEPITLDLAINVNHPPPVRTVRD